MIKLPKAGEIVEYDVMTFPTFDWNDLFKSRTIEKCLKRPPHSKVES